MKNDLQGNDTCWRSRPNPSQNIRQDLDLFIMRPLRQAQHRTSVGVGVGLRYYAIVDFASLYLDVWFDDHSDIEMPLYNVFCASCAEAQ